jgi:hypothetical protein
MTENRTILSGFKNSSHTSVVGTCLVFLLLLVLFISRNTRGISDKIFWTDEVYNYQTVVQPFWEIPKWTIKGYHMQPPLFYWIGHFVAKLGTDPLTLRSISSVFYIIMIGFVIFGLREFQLATRTFLCFVLIMSPFAEFAATEFKAYSLAALSILVSSVFFYRAMKQPSRWSSAVSYGLSALLLQFSLTLNCFAFGLQMGFLSAAVLYFCRKDGIKQTIKKYKPLIIVSAPLCIEYAVFLNILRQTGLLLFPTSSLQSHMTNYIKALWANIKILKGDIILIRSWALSFAPAALLLGCISGLRRQRGITVYLILLFGGQLLFSTFMTFSRIDWLSQRYLVASYVAFALLCAVGAEYLFQRMDTKTTIIIIACLLGTTIPGSVMKFYASLNTPVVNPVTADIDALRCRNYPTVIITDPLHDAIVPGYAYRDDPLIIVPYSELKTLHNDKSDPAERILKFASEKYCFILMERVQHKVYKGNINKILSSLPGYSVKRYSITPGLNVPDSALLFTPSGVELDIKEIRTGDS